MRNMILIVGPGTSAYRCYSNPGENDSDRSGFSEDSDDSSGIVEDEEETEDDILNETEIIYVQEQSESAEDEDQVDTSVDQAATTETPHRIHRGSEKSEIRHAGCINTASWMDCSWRMSASKEGVVPTSLSETRIESAQLVTSGDDRVIKFWDVSAAMGSASPIPQSAFDAPLGYRQTDACVLDPEEYYVKRPGIRVAGSVMPLGVFNTDHRGNVFHVSPLNYEPGKVLTCAADGNLRLLDITRETSSIVMSSSRRFESMDLLLYGQDMAFSFQMTSPNVGLLCSAAGLHRFDVRMRPREQNESSMLQSCGEQWLSAEKSCCKACAVWRPGGHDSDSDRQESNYVFAGGSSEFVALFDLRMDGSSCRVVDRFKPSGLNTSQHVSVSGIDLSRDGETLLVSYEGDVIYTFPTFSSKCCLDDIEDASQRFSENLSLTTSNLAAYGCHLNRRTFLKNAKFAGPNDEYICTGSDSGHAWVYERSTGCVASLLKADTTTCNGILPHPSLPLFVTYGIDSTAKLWRATTPVDVSVDDTRSGRRIKSCEEPFRFRTFPTDQKGVHHHQARSDLSGVGLMMYDWIPTSPAIHQYNEALNPQQLVTQSRVIRNDISRLPSVLARSTCQCFRAQNSYQKAIHHSLEHFTIRASLSRLRHQADRIGAYWSLTKPYDIITTKSHAAELVPDNPFDWIVFDPTVNPNAANATVAFNPELERRDIPMEQCPANYDGSIDEPFVRWLDHKIYDEIENEKPPWTIPQESVLTQFELLSRKLLFATTKMLKTAGNEAMKEENWHVAAKRYDKGLQYCAVVLTRYPGLFPHFEGHVGDEEIDGELPILVWSPIVELMVTLLLNQSLLLQKHLGVTKVAILYAEIALKITVPFCTKRGKKVFQTTVDEPVSTFDICQPLKAKAYFRLGSAQLLQKQFDCAVESLRESIKATIGKPDNLLLRRLHTAKQKCANKKKRDRARFERAYAEGTIGG